MKLSLANKHAIICGSTSGIGEASAILMAKQGCELTLIARNQEKLNSILGLLDKNKNQKHQTVCVDFNNPKDLKNKIELYITKLDKAVDILINNSGGPPGGPIIEAEEDEFRLAFDRLLVCNHILAKAVFPGMRDKGFGRIINVISTSVNQVISGLGVSNTIRGGVAQWGKTLALELGQYGICVNNILPGYTSTPRLQKLIDSKSQSLGISDEQIRIGWENNTALKRIATPEEIANTIVFLASDESGYITGHNLSVDGGRFG